MTNLVPLKSMSLNDVTVMNVQPWKPIVYTTHGWTLPVAVANLRYAPTDPGVYVEFKDGGLISIGYSSRRLGLAVRLDEHRIELYRHNRDELDRFAFSWLALRPHLVSAAHVEAYLLEQFQGLHSRDAKRGYVFQRVYLEIEAGLRQIVQLAETNGKLVRAN